MGGVSKNYHIIQSAICGQRHELLLWIHKLISKYHIVISHATHVCWMSLPATLGRLIWRMMQFLKRNEDRGLPRTCKLSLFILKGLRDFYMDWKTKRVVIVAKHEHIRRTQSSFAGSTDASVSDNTWTQIICLHVRFYFTLNLVNYDIALTTDQPACVR